MDHKKATLTVAFFVVVFCLFFLNLAGGPFAGKRRQIVETLEQVRTKRGDGVAVAAMAEQAGRAQFLDAGVQGVGRDVANAVLQKSKGLGMTVFQGPQHA